MKWFFEVLEGFSHQERALFLRFTWGRSRLPMREEDFARKFKIQEFKKANPDMYYPVAHTCFFSLELPRWALLECWVAA